jgi:hexosaminidase
MIGWGNEDLPYRLANAGYKVVLSCVSNMYFDLSYQKTYEEPGYYWGGFVDVDKPFYFIPFDYFKNSTEDRRGNPIEQSYFIGKDRLTDFGKSNIVGIQGLLWSENVKSPERLEYMLLPKMLGLVERAWAPDPQWAQTADTQLSKKQYQEAWNVFVNTISQRELPKIEALSGGYQFRIPTAGAKVENGKVYANIQMPSFEIRYTVDGTEPTAQSKLYTEPISEKGTIKLKVFSLMEEEGEVSKLKIN